MAKYTVEFSVHPIFSLLIESNLAGFPSSWMTELFIWATMFVFVFALFALIRGKLGQFVEYAPTLMTSLGILGTFVGILIGLLAFDTSNIDKSIPSLLEGLKTAFVTSIVGMSFTVLFNGISRLIKKNTAAAGVSNAQVSPGDILAELKLQSHVIEDIAAKLVGSGEDTLLHQAKAVRDEVNKISSSIQKNNQNLLDEISVQHGTLKVIANGLTGTEEGSLIGKIQLMRGDISDMSKVLQRNQKEFSERLWSELDKFAEMMSKSATSHIIEALSQVISDFNKNLTEQFGENFKALDASVKTLVEWQEKYRLHVEQMGVQYERSVESIGHTENAVSTISHACSAIPQAMESLQEILETNQQQLKELHNHLKAFVDMRDAAVVAVPEIQQKIDKMSEQLKVGALGIQKSAEDITKAAVQVSNELEGAIQRVSGSSEVIANVAVDLDQKMQKTSLVLLDSTQSIQVALVDGTSHLKASVAGSQMAMEEVASKVKETAAALIVSAQVTQQGLKESAKFISDSGLELKDAFSHSKTAVTIMVNQIDVAANILTESTKSIQDNLDKLINQLSGSSKEMSDLLKSSSVDLLKNNKELLDNVQRSAYEIKQFGEQVIGNMDRGVKTAIEESGKVVNKSLEQLELATAREIEKAMQDMGESLVKITSRFVKDYERMVHAMNDVISQQPNKRK